MFSSVMMKMRTFHSQDYLKSIDNGECSAEAQDFEFEVLVVGLESMEMLW
jgi:hypothetical protein